MASKLVKYNGGTTSLKGCSPASALEKGRFYEIVSVDSGDIQTNYYLKGIVGFFNAAWFDEIPVYLAVAKAKPELLKPFVCYKVSPSCEPLECTMVITSAVKKIIELSSDTYEIYTENSRYVVQNF